MTDVKVKSGNRSSRESSAHDNKTRRKPWRPVRKLEVPPAPEGYKYRWIRESMMGAEDRSNVSRRIREGWELVKGTDLPEDFQLPTMDGRGRFEGVVYNEGLLLAKMPVETVQERKDYYANKAQEQENSLDNNMFNETRSNSRYVKYDPQRDSQVTFGRK
jgi:hypothetical protein